MKYISNIQSETSRIFGPTSSLFPREVQKDCFIENIPFKKGTLILPRFYGNRFSQDFFDDPYSFNPERWDKMENLHPYVMNTFSAGARTCIGKHLALLDSKIALIKLLKRYKKITVP